ncbi:MAG TPA: hypothetical protein VN809_06765 [Telmatospirillum sp.]|nr:hypothetical protein [Telmatospirillum sp.]
MNDAPDFLSAAHRLMDEAKSLGALFHPDGTWAIEGGRAPLPATLADRLRVHRTAIAALLAEGATSDNAASDNVAEKGIGR